MADVIVIEVIVCLSDDVLQANTNTDPSHEFDYSNSPSHLRFGTVAVEGGLNHDKPLPA